MEVTFTLGENEGYIPGSLGDRLISVAGQTRSEMKLFALKQFQFQSLVKLFE